MNSLGRKKKLLRQTALVTTLLLGVVAILGSSPSSFPEFTLNVTGGNVSPIIWVWEHDTGDNFAPRYRPTRGLS